MPLSRTGRLSGICLCGEIPATGGLDHGQRPGHVRGEVWLAAKGLVVLNAANAHPRIVTVAVVEMPRCANA